MKLMLIRISGHNKQDLVAPRSIPYCGGVVV